jgi:hypothetical protein
MVWLADLELIGLWFGWLIGLWYGWLIRVNWVMV